jgi:hypothetical protein
MLTLIMAGVILLTSTGMGLVEHSCLISGHKSLQFTEKKGCCAKKATKQAESKTPILKKTNCCESNAKFFQVKLASTGERVAKFVNQLFVSFTQKITFITTSWLKQRQKICQYTNTSPPKAGRTLLIHHQTFRI